MQSIMNILLVNPTEINYDNLTDISTARYLVLREYTTEWNSTLRYETSKRLHPIHGTDKRKCGNKDEFF